jgi:hypothetical protein
MLSDYFLLFCKLHDYYSFVLLTDFLFESQFSLWHGVMRLCPKNTAAISTSDSIPLQKHFTFCTSLVIITVITSFILWLVSFILLTDVFTIQPQILIFLRSLCVFLLSTILLAMIFETYSTLQRSCFFCSFTLLHNFTKCSILF